jgi:hypothetical protein
MYSDEEFPTSMWSAERCPTPYRSSSAARQTEQETPADNNPTIPIYNDALCGCDTLFPQLDDLGQLVRPVWRVCAWLWIDTEIPRGPRTFILSSSSYANPAIRIGV